jgi:hypothetical protein
MDDSKWERWGALGGVLFAVLVAISAILPGSPAKTSDSATKILKFLNDNGDELRWSGYIGAVALIPLFWWLGSVWRLMRRAEGTPRLAVMAISGAVFAAAMATIGGVMLGALPIIGTRTLGPGGARIFYIISTDIAIATEFGTAAFLLGFSVVIIRSAALPVVMGWLGGLIALVSLVGAAAVATTRDAIFDIGFGSFIAFGVWVIIVSILMFLRTGRAVVVDTAPAPAASTA